jgi:uncharacterized protein (TIGR00266 family)
MSQFEIIGNIDPYLRVRLRQGESCYCPPGRTIMIDNTLDLRGKLKGNVVKSLFRKIATPTSFFFQSIVAERGSGECLIAPGLSGSLRILEIGELQYSIVGAAFLAGSGTARVSAVIQNVDKAIFSDTGGFFILESEGYGQLVVSGYGSLYEIEVIPGHPLLIHSAHVIAWQDTLDFDISISTTEDGLFSNIINNIMSGSGIVLRFSGHGKIVICSRNRQTFISWVKNKFI